MARATAGRDPDAQVRLALWCERHGLTAERVRHLGLALTADPKHALARGLLGLVAYRGAWAEPGAVADKVKSDAALAASLAEYNARRARTPETADGQWKLALWCEQHGLKAEARAHLTAVVRLDPSREAAWKRLGFKRRNGRWATDAQLAAERAEAEAQRKADRHWRPLLEKWRGWLARADRRAEAEAALAGVTDPRAVRAVWAAFGSGADAHQSVAVQILGQIDGPSASQALASLAIFGKSAEVRRVATETLRKRDPREFLTAVIGLIRDPINYEIRPVGGPDSPGVLFVEGERYNIQNLYVQLAGMPLPPRLFADSVPFDASGRQAPWFLLSSPGAFAPALPATPGLNPSSLSPVSAQHQGHSSHAQGTSAAGGVSQAPGINVTIWDYTLLAAQRDALIGQMMMRRQMEAEDLQQRLNRDVALLDQANATIRRIDGEATRVLGELSGLELGTDRDAWMAWWADKQGYVYEPSKPRAKPTLVQVAATVGVPAPGMGIIGECFGAGTPVRTFDGPLPIESLKVGDQVIAQDTRTGALRFQPIIAVFHNKPAPTLRITVGDEAIVATGIHRFWKPGRGWAMARDFKPGDAIRTLGGVAQVAEVEPAGVQPVFNLEVAEGQSFFGGTRGVLVHDNSLVAPTPEPFDRVAAE